MTHTATLFASFLQQRRAQYYFHVAELWVVNHPSLPCLLPQDLPASAKIFSTQLYSQNMQARRTISTTPHVWLPSNYDGNAAWRVDRLTDWLAPSLRGALDISLLSPLSVS